MPTSDAITVTALDRIEEAVWVTTVSTPPTSLPSRDWMSPVRVPVKKPRCIDSRCTNSRLRRSCMTRLPSEVVRNVCPTPISADTIGITIMRATRTNSSRRSGPPGTNRAWSNTALVRNGFAIPSTEVTRIAVPINTSRARYGVNSSATRRVSPASPASTTPSMVHPRCRPAPPAPYPPASWV